MGIRLAPLPTLASEQAMRDYLHRVGTENRVVGIFRGKPVHRFDLLRISHRNLIFLQVDIVYEETMVGLRTSRDRWNGSRQRIPKNLLNWPEEDTLLYSSAWLLPLMKRLPKTKRYYTS